MLRISRQEGDRIIIDGDIELEVLKVGTKNIQLGFMFPENKTVYREEVIKRIKKKKNLRRL
jgi:carbon storage regulator CsrA